MSTYSPSLRIELIGDGEQVGIWGDTTNSNLGTVLESAITGNTNVIVTSVDQVLTVRNGAADQSRNAVLVLAPTGAITTAFNVYAPPVNKTYIIVNNGAYKATVYCSSVTGNTTPAGAGVLVAAGKTVQAWTEGTNFYLSASSVDLPLAASQGGTGLTSSGAVGNFLQSDGTGWISSASGGGTVAGGTILETSQTLDIPYTLTANKNGMTISPFNITGSGALTVPSGSRFVII